MGGERRARNKAKAGSEACDGMDGSMVRAEGTAGGLVQGKADSARSSKSCRDTQQIWRHELLSEF